MTAVTFGTVSTTDQRTALSLPPTPGSSSSRPVAAHFTSYIFLTIDGLVAGGLASLAAVLQRLLQRRKGYGIAPTMGLQPSLASAARQPDDWADPGKRCWCTIDLAPRDQRKPHPC